MVDSLTPVVMLIHGGRGKTSKGRFPAVEEIPEAIRPEVVIVQIRLACFRIETWLRNLALLRAIFEEPGQVGNDQA